MITQLRRVESALGDGVKRPMPSELNTRKVARKSIVSVRPLPAGHVIALSDLAIKRPGDGVPPGHLKELQGRVLRKEMKADEALHWEYLLPRSAGA